MAAVWRSVAPRARRHRRPRSGNGAGRVLRSARQARRHGRGGRANRERRRQPQPVRNRCRRSHTRQAGGQSPGPRGSGVLPLAPALRRHAFESDRAEALSDHLYLIVSASRRAGRGAAVSAGSGRVCGSALEPGRSVARIAIPGGRRRPPSPRKSACRASSDAARRDGSPRETCSTVNLRLNVLLPASYGSQSDVVSELVPSPQSHSIVGQ